MCCSSGLGHRNALSSESNLIKFPSVREKHHHSKLLGRNEGSTDQKYSGTAPPPPQGEGNDSITQKQEEGSMLFPPPACQAKRNCFATGCPTRPHCSCAQTRSQLCHSDVKRNSSSSRTRQYVLDYHVSNCQHCYRHFSCKC